MKTEIILNSIKNNDSTVPAWAHGAVIYQIFPDRFKNGSPENDVTDNAYVYGSEYETGPIPIRRADWDSPVEDPDVGRFYGGDLPGILEKLPYLKQLGVEVLYLTPVFESLSNHKYDCMNYEQVDPHLTGTGPEEANAWFAQFVKTLHENGIRVILDGVFNHCSSSHPFFQSALKDADSPYCNYFRFDETGEPEYWWHVKTLPKFNYEGSKELEDYMMGIAAKWVSEPYCCDGWRLDVAADLGHSEEYNHHFWKRFRETVRKANPEAVVLAEQYDSPEPWIRNGEWDTVMNYRGFMDPVSFFLTGMEKHSDARDGSLEGNVPAFWEAIKSAYAELGNGNAVFAAMNELDNHDHSRMVTRTGKQVGRIQTAGTEKAAQGLNLGLYRTAAVLLMTLPGAPTIYYGDETALPGWTDPDSRRPYPWGKEDREMIGFFSALSRLHKTDALRVGSLEVPQEAEGEALVFLRRSGSEAFLILVNPTGQTLTKTVPLDEGRKANRILHTTEHTVSLGEKADKELQAGKLVSCLAPFSAKIYRIRDRKAE